MSQSRLRAVFAAGLGVTAALFVALPTGPAAAPYVFLRASAAPAASAFSFAIAMSRDIGAMPQLVQG